MLKFTSKSISDVHRFATVRWNFENAALSRCYNSARFTHRCIALLEVYPTHTTAFALCNGRKSNESRNCDPLIKWHSLPRLSANALLGAPSSSLTWAAARGGANSSARGSLPISQSRLLGQLQRSCLLLQSLTSLLTPS